MAVLTVVCTLVSSALLAHASPASLRGGRSLQQTQQWTSRHGLVTLTCTEFQENVVYNKGDCVIFGGELYSVHWWSRLNAGSSGDPEKCRWFDHNQAVPGCYYDTGGVNGDCPSDIQGCPFERLTNVERPIQSHSSVVGLTDGAGGCYGGEDSSVAPYGADTFNTTYCRGWGAPTVWPKINNGVNGGNATSSDEALYMTALSSHIFDFLVGLGDEGFAHYSGSKLYTHVDPLAGAEEQQGISAAHRPCGTCWRIFAKGYGNDKNTIAKWEDSRDVVVVDKMQHDIEETYVDGDASNVPVDFASESAFRAFDLDGPLWSDTDSTVAWIRTGNDKERQCHGRVSIRFQMISCDTREPISGVSGAMGTRFPASSFDSNPTAAPAASPTGAPTTTFAVTDSATVAPTDAPSTTISPTEAPVETTTTQSSGLSTTTSTTEAPVETTTTQSSGSGCCSWWGGVCGGSSWCSASQERCESQCTGTWLNP